jgi:hypothetical protein
VNFDFDVPLLFPSDIEIFPLDVASMAADPDGAGALTTGIDPDYRAPALLPSADRTGKVNRLEGTAITIPAQVDPESLERLQMMPTGDQNGGTVFFTVKFADLEESGLLDSKGNPKLRRARIGSIKKDDEVVYAFPDPPGMFVDQVVPSTGFNGRPNTLTIRCSTRDPA